MSSRFVTLAAPFKTTETISIIDDCVPPICVQTFMIGETFEGYFVESDNTVLLCTLPALLRSVGWSVPDIRKGMEQFSYFVLELEGGLLAACCLYPHVDKNSFEHTVRRNAIAVIERVISAKNARGAKLIMSFVSARGWIQNLPPNVLSSIERELNEEENKQQQEQTTTTTTFATWLEEEAIRQYKQTNEFKERVAKEAKIAGERMAKEEIARMVNKKREREAEPFRKKLEDVFKKTDEEVEKVDPCEKVESRGKVEPREKMESPRKYTKASLTKNKTVSKWTKPVHTTDIVLATSTPESESL